MRSSVLEETSSFMSAGHCSSQHQNNNNWHTHTLNINLLPGAFKDKKVKQPKTLLSNPLLVVTSSSQSSWSLIFYFILRPANVDDVMSDWNSSCSRRN